MFDCALSDWGATWSWATASGCCLPRRRFREAVANGGGGGESGVCVCVELRSVGGGHGSRVDRSGGAVVVRGGRGQWALVVEGSGRLGVSPHGSKDPCLPLGKDHRGREDPASMPKFWEVRGLKWLLDSGMLERRNVVAARAGAIGSGVARAGSGQSDGVGDGVQPTTHTPNDPVGHDSGVPRPIRRANASEHFFSGAPPFGGGTRAPR